MKLKELLHLMNNITQKNDLSPCFIVGGTVRDKVLGRLDHISDLDITTGDDDIAFLSKELSIVLTKQYHIQTKTMNDGHVSIFMGDLKVDFSSNFNVPGIEQILMKMGVSQPTDMQKELFSRDFTCNALLMDFDLKTISDPTEMGLKDIKEKKIRTCLSPEITLTSNKNRVVRAIYLAAKLGFDLDEAIIEFVKKNPSSITIASDHSLKEKLNAALDFDEKKTVGLLDQMGLWDQIPINERLYPLYKQRVR